ncbi:MAG: hypothetical protein FJX62_03110 [Alphaproteobacteria bacterium]|nr:hypothetical protein [Alphaproteobacteria bacterium]
MKSIAFNARSEFRGLLLGLARVLKEKHGSTLHLYCSTEQVREYYSSRGTGLFDTVTSLRDLMNVATAPVSESREILEEARRNEARLGTTYGTFVLTNRHFGRGFSLGGFRHPRSRYSENSTATQLLHAYNMRFAFWEREFREKSITLNLNGNKESQSVARLHGISSRAIIGSRYKHYHYWCENEYFESEAIARAYRSIATAPLRDVVAPYDSHMQYRVTFMREMGLPRALYDMGRMVAKHAYWRLRGYEKAKGYYMTEEMLFYWRRWKSTRDLTGPRVSRLSDLEGRPFVFFPLHAEPESSLQTASPEYFSQLWAIASLARDLPAGYTLAVKETYQTQGRRPDNFYDQIREFKNVVLLDLLELGPEVVRKADAVATITGTAGLEAAIMGKPVISFGRHNLYNVLPHVTVIEREEDLATALRRVLIDGVDSVKAKADAARLLQAIIDNSFDMGSFDFNKPDVVEQTVVDDAAERLVANLAVERPATGLERAV